VTTYFHVAGPDWRPGDALLSLEQRVTRGEADISDWRWAERPYGDGSEHRIFLFRVRAEAIEFQVIHGGTLLRVTDPEDVRADPAEGYPCVFGPIPAALLEVA
jgi:hypothetical protein